MDYYYKRDKYLNKIKDYLLYVLTFILLSFSMYVW